MRGDITPEMRVHGHPPLPWYVYNLLFRCAISHETMDFRYHKECCTNGRDSDISLSKTQEYNELVKIFIEMEANYENALCFPSMLETERFHCSSGRLIKPISSEGDAPP